MSRNDQVGGNAPRQGTLIRTSQSGVAAFRVRALERFPPPDFLTPMQQNLWIAALADIPLEFFRARHIPMMIQYVRSTEHMMKASDEYEADPEDMILLNRWERLIRLTGSIEKKLSLDAVTLSSRVVRARAEQRVAIQKDIADEAGAVDHTTRAGLVYVGH